MFELDLNDDEQYQIIETEDHNLSIYKLEKWQSNILVSFLCVCLVIDIVGKGMIIFYIGNYAPKERPINRMILVDQVREHS